MNKICVTMFAVFVALAMVSPIAAAWYGGIEGEEYTEEVECGWADESPTLDGFITEGEYGNATMVDIFYYPEPPHRNDTIYIYFMNDENFLYVAVDLLPDNTSDAGDYVWLSIDEDNDDAFEPEDPDMEGWYVIYMSSGTIMSWSEYTIFAEEEGVYPSPESNKPFLWAAGFEETVNDDAVEHRVWEMAIPIAQMNDGDVELGDTMRLGLGGYGTLAPTWLYPINGTIVEQIDSSDWAEVTLATAPELPPPVEEATHKFAVIMVGFALVLSINMLIFYRGLILRPIADGKVNYVLVLMGLIVIASLLSVLDFYYNIGSWLGM